MLRQAAARHPLRLQLLALVASTASTLAARGQPQWLSPNQSPPDTPPTITFLAGESDSNRSIFRITLNGLWIEPTIIQEQAFQRLAIPEHRGRLAAVGRPAVPRIGLTLHIPSTAEQIGVGAVQVLASQPLSGIRVFPAQAPELELPDGEYERPPFEFDAGFYEQRQNPYPMTRARAGAASGTLRRVRVQGALVQPLRAVPADDLLILDWDLLVEFIHQGPPGPPIAMTRRTSHTLRELLANVGSLPDNWHVNWLSYDACYLVVTPPEYEDGLQPLVRLKREQGYRTTVLTTDETGSTPAEIKTAIEDWYDDCDDQGDAYVLLVGDVGQMPMHTDPEFGNPSDHYYACLDGDTTDIYPEVGLVRLSVDDETDCAEQVEKIVRYQDDPPLFSTFYERILLAAHNELYEDGSARYVEIMEEISSILGYYTAFDVTERFGTEPDGLVSLTLDDLDAGQNIAVYRGHGSSSRWSSWDYDNQSLDTTDVRGLTNGEKTGLVLSVACTNNGLDLSDDCFGETFMEGAENGSVAHYGATRISYTGVNHDLAYWFMLGGRSYPTLADGFTVTWLYVRSFWDDHWKSRYNNWIYLLLGDPAMKLWSENPRPIYVLGPGTIHQGAPFVTLQVTDDDGEPVEGAIVTLVQGDRLLGNRYADADGLVTIPVEGLDAGELVARVYDDLTDDLGNRITVPVLAACVEDLDGSGAVDFGDVLAILAAWGNPGGPEDLDGSGTVDFGDVLFILARWGPCP